MDDLLIEQLEWLISCNITNNRLARHLLILCGALADTAFPDHINRQMISLSRQALLQEMLDSLINSLNQLIQFSLSAKHAWHQSAEATSMDCGALIAQIEDSRQKLLQCEPVNYAELTAWVVAQAKQQNLWTQGRRR